MNRFHRSLFERRERWKLLCWGSTNKARGCDRSADPDGIRQRSSVPVMTHHGVPLRETALAHLALAWRSPWGSDCLGRFGLSSETALGATARLRPASRGKGHAASGRCLNRRRICRSRHAPLPSLRRACDSLDSLVISVSLRPCSKEGTKGNSVMGASPQGRLAERDTRGAGRSEVVAIGACSKLRETGRESFRYRRVPRVGSQSRR
jgi:hypothetical protein